MGEARHRSGTSRWLSVRWPSRPRALAALAAASVGLVGTIALTSQGGVAVASEHRPVFDDGFDGGRGSALDRGRWLLDGDDRNARQDGEGNLVVDRLISTRQAFAEPYGHAEARIKVRRADGPWRAFGAVDKYGRVLRGNVDTLDRRADPTSGRDFHTYAIDWSPQVVVWSVDGTPSLKLTPEEPGLPIALVLNLAADGRRPARMVVDFVKVTAGKKPMPMPTTPGSSAPTASVPPSEEPSETPPVTPSEAPPVTPSAAPTTPAAPKPAAWKAFTAYEAGDLVTYDGATYQVREAHTALPGWEPSALPNLFKKV